MVWEDRGVRRLFALIVALVAVAASVAACGTGDAANATSAPAATPAAPDAASTSGDAASAATGPAVPATKAQLIGRSYTAREAYGHTLAPGSTLTLQFEPAYLAASAGCNQISGAYTLTGGTLTLRRNPAMTQMACDTPLMRQERWLKTWLTSGVQATTNGAALTLTANGVTITFMPGPANASTPTIAGTPWRLIATANRGAAQVELPSTIKAPTLDITTAGNAAIFTGCNHANGAVDVRDDGFLIFSQLATTRMACVGDVGTLETQVLAVLNGKVAAAFDGAGHLVLTNDGRRLIYAAA
jgi:heat shock protein HslJ